MKPIKINGRKVTTFDFVLAAIAIFIGIFTVYPMWYVICMSVSQPEAVMQGTVTFFPIGFSLDSFGIALKDNAVYHALLMTVLYVLFGLAIMLTSCMMMAFPLTRPNLKGRKFVVFFLLIPMYFGGGMIASYVWVAKFLKLYNTFWAVALPGISIWNIILCRTFLASIPRDLSEAAYIDGAGNLQVLLKIYVPLAAPVLAVISIYTIVGVWNSWFGSMLYQTKEELHPIQMYLQRMLIAQKVDLVALTRERADPEVIANAVRQSQLAYQLKYSMIVFITLPILLVYPMFQKHFVKGVMLGSLKG